MSKILFLAATADITKCNGNKSMTRYNNANELNLESVKNLSKVTLAKTEKAVLISSNKDNLLKAT